MQKDTRNQKGETQQFGQSKEAHKVKEFGNDLNAKLKENVGVGVGNYSSEVDREKASEHRVNYDEQMDREKFEKNKRELERKLVGDITTDKDDKTENNETGVVGNKMKEIGHTLNANLKENLGVGIGNYPPEVDRQIATENRKDFNEKYEKQKEYVSEKTEELKDKAESGSTGIYTHKIQEVTHNINATLKENLGLGVGNYSSEVDRERASEHREKYDEKVKEESKPEITEATSLGHKIREVAHTVNANLKEMIGIGVGNYSSEVDRELANIHHEKYEEMTSGTRPGESLEGIGGEKFEKRDENWKENELKKDDNLEVKQVKIDVNEKVVRSKEAKQDDLLKQKSGSGDNKL